MVHCLSAPSHYINQCCLLINEVPWHSPESNFITGDQVDILHNECENRSFTITAISHRGNELATRGFTSHWWQLNGILFAVLANLGLDTYLTSALPCWCRHLPTNRNIPIWPVRIKGHELIHLSLYIILIMYPVIRTRHLPGFGITLLVQPFTNQPKHSDMACPNQGPGIDTYFTVYHINSVSCHSDGNEWSTFDDVNPSTTMTKLNKFELHMTSHI